MTAVLTASSRAVPPTLVGKISKARGATVTIGIRVLDSNTFYVAMGPSSGVPATYADFSTDHGGSFPLPGGSGSLAYDLNAAAFVASLKAPTPTAVGTIGEGWYVAVFQGSSGVPDSAAVPDAVAGPFELVA